MDMETEILQDKWYIHPQVDMQTSTSCSQRHSSARAPGVFLVRSTRDAHVGSPRVCPFQARWLEGDRPQVKKRSQD